MQRLGLLLILAVNYAAAICDFITQQPGQYCHDLAVRCKISDADFFKYNPNIKTDCSNLSAGSRVCCGPGGLAPGPDADGRCAVYEVKANVGDNCGKIGGQYGLTIDQINNFNFKSTTSFGGSWGFRGCQNLQPGKICISKGTKGPIPALQKDAKGNPVPCGPTASGNGTNVQCPLKACCNSWGQCGLTDDFCKVTNSKLNPGVSGCQDNCEIKYIKGSAPSSFTKVGYYETWNQKWPCLNARIRDIDLSEYTHVHYSFADILPDYTIYMDPLAKEQFNDFKAVSGVKKIVSFGGWGISTEPATFQHLRLMVQNPDKYVNALVAFAENNNLDGIDIDWEYPGATDIPGLPAPGLPSDGPDYLKFLHMLRDRLPKSKSISIAAPASFWYLKNFPIVEMSKILDYIVFMTYDLHGQWDYNIPSLGPHLLSHVNWTETQSMLDLITHAGVPSNKVLLGLAKYGRSFQQVDPSCYGPSCKFTGPDSGATPGKCTKTAGYIGLGEIKQIKKEDIRKSYVDAGSQIMTYGKDQWISYLTDDQLKERTDKAKDMNLGGTITWAIDLDSKESVNTCNMSRVMMIGDLKNTVCSNHDMRSFFVDFILDSIDHWHLIPVADYDSGMAKFTKHYNITKPHPPKDTYDPAFKAMTGFIDKLPSGDVSDYQMSLLYFYAKRCAVFYQPSKSNKKRFSLPAWGVPEGYIPLLEFGGEAAAEAGVVAGAETAAVSTGLGAALGIPFLGEALVGLGAIFIGIWISWNQPLYPVPDSVITLAQGNQEQLDKIRDLIMNPNYVQDYYNSISSIDYGTDIDPIDSEIIPGPYTRQTSFILNRINSPYYWNLRKKSTDCKADDRVNINNENYADLMTKLTDKKKKEKSGTPVYWINHSGRSPGVACNAWYYFSKKMLEGDDIDSINVYSKYDKGKDRKYYLEKYDCSKYGKIPQTDNKGVTRMVAKYQRDEFPFAKTYEGMITEQKEYDVAIACVDGADNGSDGSYFGQFLAATGIYEPWNDHVIGQPSGRRNGALTDHEEFLIKIYNLPPIDTCPENVDANGALVLGFAMTPDGTDRRPNVINHYYEAIS